MGILPLPYVSADKILVGDQYISHFTGVTCLVPLFSLLCWPTNLWSWLSGRTVCVRLILVYVHKMHHYFILTKKHVASLFMFHIHLINCHISENWFYAFLCFAVSSKALLRRPLAGSQVPYCPLGKRVPDSWSDVEPGSFRIRGANYFR